MMTMTATRRLLMLAVIASGCHSTCNEPSPPGPASSSQAEQTEGVDAGAVANPRVGPIPFNRGFRVHTVQPLSNASPD